MSIKIDEFKKAKTEINEYILGWKSKTVCFSGHRPQNLSWNFDEDNEEYKRVWYEALNYIERAIQKGYTTFITGMALGFDLMCADIVIYLKD